MNQVDFERKTIRFPMKRTGTQNYEVIISLHDFIFGLKLYLLL
jgi:hypothetical protein